MAASNNGIPAGVIDLSCGSSHTAGLLNSGIAITFGRGEDGQLGHGNSDEVLEPKAVFALLDKAITSVHCGAEYTLAVSAPNLQVYSWGWGDFGRLGHGCSEDVFVPRPITFFSGIRIKHVACGDSHTMIITDAGELFSFGRNQNGQLGLGHTDDQLSPQRVEALQGQHVTCVSAGAEHTIAATSNGEVYGWGWGRYGNIGDGHQQDRLLPTRVLGLEGAGVVTVNCGWRHSVALTKSGKLYAWGWNNYGQLGLGDNKDRFMPTCVETLQDHVMNKVAGGWRHTMAADATGCIWGWGWNKFGQLGCGDMEDRHNPTLVTKLQGQPCQRLACGWRHTMAITQAGQVYAWGRGVNGQLGLGTDEDKHEPALVACLSQGTLDEAAIRASASPTGGYVCPEDRYAVVPGGLDDGMEVAYGAVPTVPDVQGPGKKPRVSNT